MKWIKIAEMAITVVTFVVNLFKKKEEDEKKDEV